MSRPKPGPVPNSRKSGTVPDIEAGTESFAGEEDPLASIPRKAIPPDATPAVPNGPPPGTAKSRPAKRPAPMKPKAR